ncbi:MAG: hypothetical protein M3522_03305 [Actinomycetota bacterium]|nr:hypothetical protein [Actinomycetota bacterium]
MDDWERLTVPEACEALGLSEGAVRKRVARGTLASERDADGRVLIVLDAATRREADGQTAGQEEPPLVEALRDQIGYLQRQVEEEREARRRADIMLSRLMDRLPELEAPPETRQEPSESPERQDASGTRLVQQEPAQGQESRPWWKKLLGG